MRQRWRVSAFHLQDEDGFTALLFAAGNGHARAVRLLLAAGASKDARTDGGASAAALAAKQGHAACVEALAFDANTGSVE